MSGRHRKADALPQRIPGRAWRDLTTNPRLTQPGDTVYAPDPSWQPEENLFPMLVRIRDGLGRL